MLSASEIIAVEKAIDADSKLVVEIVLDRSVCRLEESGKIVVAEFCAESETNVASCIVVERILSRIKDWIVGRGLYDDAGATSVRVCPLIVTVTDSIPIAGRDEGAKADVVGRASVGICASEVNILPLARGGKDWTGIEVRGFVDDVEVTPGIIERSYEDI